MKIVDQQVTYLDHMGSDLSVVNAARVSFSKESKWGCTESLDLKLSEADEKLISYLAKHNHWSPFAHASISFRVKAPIFVARQLVKHMVGFSWNEVSRRYVDDDPEFYIPQEWRLRASNVKQGSSEEIHKDTHGIRLNVIDSTINALSQYHSMLTQGICPEQARMVLPQNTMTEWIWTGSLYGFARMCQLRLDSHTQVETREIAQMVSTKMAELFPISWKVLLNDSSSN